MSEVEHKDVEHKDVVSPKDCALYSYWRKRMTNMSMESSKSYYTKGKGINFIPRSERRIGYDYLFKAKPYVKNICIKWSDFMLAKKTFVYGVGEVWATQNGSYSFHKIEQLTEEQCDDLLWKIYCHIKCIEAHRYKVVNKGGSDRWREQGEGREWREQIDRVDDQLGYLTALF